MAAAIASIVSYPATLAVIVRVPPLGVGPGAHVALRRATVSLVAVSVVVAACSASLTWTLPTTAEVGGQAAVMLLGQGLFFVAQAKAIGALDFPAVARMRLVYGVLSVVLSVLACIYVRSSFGISLASAAAMTLAAVTALMGRGGAPGKGGPQPERLRTALREGRDSRWGCRSDSGTSPHRHLRWCCRCSVRSRPLGPW